LEIDPQKSPISNLQFPILWMGLGPGARFAPLGGAGNGEGTGGTAVYQPADLLSRVELQKKEITHLIQCGALDGLGDSRAALLAEAADVARAGSAHQLGFDLGLKAAVEWPKVWPSGWGGKRPYSVGPSRQIRWRW
jgi:hypothetical protein